MTEAEQTNADYYQNTASQMKVKKVKEDFLETLKICTPITEKDCRYNIVIRVIQNILRLFAPLM